MVFSKRLHEPIRAGIVTCSVRIWKRMHARVGGWYRIGSGGEYVVVDSIEPIEMDAITEALAVESGFDDLDDLMKVCRHGQGDQAFLIRFHYVDGDINDP